MGLYAKPWRTIAFLFIGGGKTSHVVLHIYLRTWFFIPCQHVLLLDLAQLLPSLDLWSRRSEKYQSKNKFLYMAPPLYPHTSRSVVRGSNKIWNWPRRWQRRMRKKTSHSSISSQPHDSSEDHCSCHVMCINQSFITENSLMSSSGRMETSLFGNRKLPLCNTTVAVVNECIPANKVL